MKRALQAILIAPENVMRQDILTGKKKLTIREGHRDYTPGPAMLCCHLVPWAVQVEVVKVEHTTLNDVSVDDILADGFESYFDAVAKLRRFYPKIGINSNVTVVHWENPTGYLVEMCQAYQNGVKV